MTAIPDPGDAPGDKDQTNDQTADQANVSAAMDYIGQRRQKQMLQHCQL